MSFRPYCEARAITSGICGRPAIWQDPTDHTWLCDRHVPPPMPRARIAVTSPMALNGDFQFELVDVDGPRPGSQLAVLTVPGRIGPDSRPTQSPSRSLAAQARTKLHAVGEQRGYLVTDY